VATTSGSGQVQGMDGMTLTLVVPRDPAAFQEAFDRLWSPSTGPDPATTGGP
jgi:hypothetical protein